MSGKVAIIGAGLIGRAWAVVFARAGWLVRVWDQSGEAMAGLQAGIDRTVDDLAEAGLVANALAVKVQIAPADSLEDALSGADWVQESVAEKVEIKQTVFAELDRLAAAKTVLASSSSAIAASRFTETLTGRGRCLVAHPVNPPSLIPLVEICPAPWTDPAVVETARTVMSAVGMSPVTVNKEVEGFVLNRLQGALLAEAFRLVDQGVASVEDIDRTVKDGLGLRWSFMGPFETIDLNAPGGLPDYCARYGPFYERVQNEATPLTWSPDLVARITAERRQVLGEDELDARQTWRDRRLMRLIAHKAAAETSSTTDTGTAMTTDIAETMRCIEIREPGAPEVLTLAHRPVPEPAPHEVLIKVAHAGVNRPDVLQRTGNYRVPKDASDLPGLEVSGVIVAKGAAVERWSVGDQVCALTPGGGYAEYCLTPGAHCLPVPTPLGLREAAALPETYYTVWTNVFMRGRLKEGESILIHGGSSGIGTTAIQLAKAFGADVYTTAGSMDKCMACLELGATYAMNYKDGSWPEEIQKLGGVDVVLDMVGAPYIAANIDCLKPDGRLVQIAFLQGAKVAEFNFTKMMINRLTLTGSTLRPQSIEAKAEIARGLEEHVWPLLEAGEVKPIMHSSFPLAEAAKAHELMETSTHIGKIVLDV